MKLKALLIAGAVLASASAQAADLVKFGTLDTPKVVYIGMEKGFFAEEGIEVEPVSFRSGAAIVPAVSTGQIDVAATSPGAALYNAIGSGVNVTIVADYFKPEKDGPGGDATAVVVRKDLVDSGAYKTPADAKGKTVAVTARGQITDLLANRFLEQAGLKAADVRIVNLPYPDMLAGLKGQSIDLAVSIDPYLEIAQRENLAVPVISASELLPGLTQGVILYSPRLAQENRDLGMRFMRAFHKSNAYVRQRWSEEGGRAEIAKIYQKYNPLEDPATYERIGLSVGPANVAVDIEGKTGLAWQLEWYRSEGLIKTAPDWSKAVDNSFAEAAAK